MDTETSKEYKILIAVPTMGHMHVNLTTHMIRWAKKFEKGVINFFFTYKVSPVDRARNQIVDFFLNGIKHPDGSKTDFTHLFFVDSDTIPPKDALERLLAHEKDIITGMTPMLHYDKANNVWGTFFNCWESVKDAAGNIIQSKCPHPNTGVKEIERCGGSCLLIKREVFDKLKTPYFQFLIKENGLDHIKSEDIYFCDSAREQGFKIWVDTSVVCQHHKEVML